MNRGGLSCLRAQLLLLLLLLLLPLRLLATHTYQEAERCTQKDDGFVVEMIALTHQRLERGLPIGMLLQRHQHF